MLGRAGRAVRKVRYLLIWPAVVAYRRRARRSLRWRLTGYNLATLIAGLATALILVGALAAAGASARRYADEEPADDARVVAEFLSESRLVDPGQPVDPSEVQPMLDALASGELPLYRGPDRDQFDVRPKQFLQGVSGIVIRGRPQDSWELRAGVVATPGASFAEVVAQGYAGSTRLRANSRVEADHGVGAYPLRDSNGSVYLVVVVEKHDIQAPRGWAVVRAEIRPVVTSVWVGSVVAAIPGLAVAALLAVAAARTVAGRVRKVADAAEALADGSFERRVPVEGEDEVASLGRSFNAMAERLQQTISSLETERARAVHLLDANRQLVANVSHELRTPVALIRGQVEALDEDAPGNPRVAMALRETSRLETLVADLFQLAAAEAGALKLESVPVELGAFAGETLAPLIDVARRESGVAVAIDAGSPVTAMADRERLARVLQNLVRNAVRHVPEGGLVRVEVSRSAEFALIAVRDTGAGISAEDLPHVFERFYRGDASRSREGGGAGLGLAMAREFVEAMGGTIEVASDPGEGSTFTVALPYAG